MLSENIKNLRKNKGFTQEELANQLQVVRQTVSKWEKGYSVPDAELLKRIAEILDTDVSQLLGSPIAQNADTDAVAEQLSRINEQLIIKNRRSHRIWKTIGIGFLVFLGIQLILAVLGGVMFHNFSYSGSYTEEYVEEIVETE